MSLRTISSGPITFSSPSDKLSLDVDYQVALRLPSRKLETLSIGECLKALTSGEIWVAHGNSCRMDFSITLNGRELIETNNNHMIELLGKFVADAKVCEPNTPEWRSICLFLIPRHGHSLDYPQYFIYKTRHYKREVSLFSSIIMNLQPRQLLVLDLGQIQPPISGYQKQYSVPRWNS